MEVLDARLSILNQFSNFIYSEENKGGIFAPKFVLKKYFKMSDVDMVANDAELAKIMKPEPAAETPGEGGEAEAGGEETPPPESGGEVPEAPKLELPELPETPPVGKESASGKKKKTAESFHSKFIPPSELHEPRSKKQFDLITDWKKADYELLKRNKLKNDDIL